MAERFNPLQSLRSLSTQRQLEIAGLVAGLLGAAGLVAAFKSEKFRQLLKDAGDATKDVTEDTLKDAWEILTQEVPGLGERAAQRFGEKVANPLVGGLANELHGQNFLGDLVGEFFGMMRRSRAPHPLAQRVRIEKDNTSEK